MLKDTKEFNIDFIDCKSAILKLFSDIKNANGVIVAYSLAELDIIKSIIPSELIPEVQILIWQDPLKLGKISSIKVNLMNFQNSEKIKINL